ncbi:helix-turn-helix domain-containing protein [Streptomyces sp. NPDC054933]
MRAFTRYLTPSAEHRGLGLVCLGVGWQRINQKRWDGRITNCYGLRLVTRGTGWFSWGDRPRRRLPVHAPTAFVTFPGVYHTYQPDPEGWWERWLLFDGPSARTHEELGCLDRDAPVMPLRETLQPMHALFDALFTVADSKSPHRDVAASSLVHRMLAELLTAKSDSDLSRVVRYLDARAIEPLSVGEHARRLGMDEPTLRRETLRATGATPKEYILRCRLRQAKRLLITTDCKIAEIARSVGYNDAAYFTRLFSRRVKQSPREFRRLASHPAEAE